METEAQQRRMDFGPPSPFIPCSMMPIINHRFCTPRDNPEALNALISLMALNAPNALNAQNALMALNAQNALNAPNALISLMAPNSLMALISLNALFLI